MKINVCAHGNPLNSSTWSGTSASIINILLEKDLLGKTVDFSLNPLSRKVLHFLSKLFYHQKVELHRSPFVKMGRAAFITLSQPLFKETAVLHMSNMGLPLLINYKKHRHYLVLDSTWNLWSQYSILKSQYSKKFIKDVERLEFKIYGQMQHIFSLSRYVKSDLVEHYKIPESKITVIGTGRGAIQPFHGEKDYSLQEILFVANKRFEDKGGQILIDAFNIAINTNPTLKLNVVGIEKSRIEYYVTKSRNIEFHGFLDQEKLQALFNRSSLFVMPGLNEPWGLVYLEALSCKCPVIGFNTNAFPEISGNGRFGFILDTYDPHHLAMLIIEAFSDLGRLKSMGIKGQKHVLGHYTWDKAVDSILHIINEQ